MGKISTLFVLVFALLSLSADAQPRWYKMETHCHSNHSGDGYIPPLELLQMYKDRGYEVVFMSDHDTLTDAESFNFPGILSINAIELSCGNHFNGLNMKRDADACGWSNQQKVDTILANDALVCVNHPFSERWRLYAEDILSLQGKLTLIEIYNSVDFLAQDDQSLWDSLLTAGLKIWGVAAGDVHLFYPLEDVWLGWSMVKLDSLSKDAVLDAIVRGDIYASTGVEIDNYEVNGDSISISCTNCTKIIFWGQNHTKLKQFARNNGTYVRQPTDKYVRVELILNSTTKAWTQPVFFDTPTGVRDNENILVQSIYPNPTSDHFTLEYSLKKPAKVNLALYDIQGRKMNEFSSSKTAGSQKEMIDV